jgi:hypothetical protein
MRREGSAVALLCAALVLTSLGLFERRAEARLDPMRIITSQLVRPNILFVLDTSGSMAERPETSDWPNDIVGGDCYNGQKCRTSALPDTCDDGQSCAPPGTCADGVTACGGNACPNGAACAAPTRLCGTFPGKTSCRDSSPKCKDGSACNMGLCQVNGTTVCGSNNDCPNATCSNTCLGAPNKLCSSNSQCAGTNSCFRRCSTTGAACSTTGASCGPGGLGVCRRACSHDNSLTCSSSTADAICNPCVSAVKRCANATSTACTMDSQCPKTPCDMGTPACAASTGSTSCSYWCSDGNQCGAPEPSCVNQNGTRAACSECTDGTPCFNQLHCGTSTTCPSSNVFKGSSRMAIAKRAMVNIATESSPIANIGLMTFAQTTYFPYRGGLPTVTTETRFFDTGDLDDANARNSDGSPKTTFTQNGTLYTLVPAANPGGNSEYRRRRNQTDQDFCGTTCTINGRSYTYQGSYYTFARTVPPSSTVTFFSSYQGKSSTAPVGYTYYDFPIDYASLGGTCGSSSRPICGDTGSPSSCSVTENNAAMLREGIELSDTASLRTASQQRMKAWLQEQDFGGVVAQGGTPSGCTLQYNLSGVASVGNSNDAYSYMVNLKNSDPLNTCRPNYIIFVTDGEPNGPGDDGTCNDTVCSNPASLGSCSCRMIKAAKNLADQGVKTFAIGFGPATAGSATMDNLARVGGTCNGGRCAFSAKSEIELVESLRSAVYEALKGDYATSAPTVATSTQTGATFAGNVGLLASADFPSWNGHLRAVDLLNLSGSTPPVLWDAGQKLADRDWATRKVYTSHPSSNAIIGFTPGNASTLFSAGLGQSAAEADEIIRFVLGQGRPWKLGPIFNATAVTAQSTVDTNIPSHAGYVTQQGTRPRMVYVGDDFGTLHAFYLESGAWGAAGEEAWAYIPPEMFPLLVKLTTGNGQPTDPFKHLYGLASSPKLNDVCASPCQATSDWRTILVSGAGIGSTSYFALDITDDPLTGNPPFSVLWRTATSSTLNARIGQSWSVPAFGFASVAGVTTSTVSFASGYDDTTGDGQSQGTYVNVLNAVSGVPLASAQYTAPGGTIVEYAVLADTANVVSPSTSLLVASYQADLAGRVWRLNGGLTPQGTPIYNAGAGHPIYYAPAAFLNSDNSITLALADGTFDDPALNPPAGAYTPELTVLIDVDGSTANLRSIKVPITGVCKSNCNLVAGGGGCNVSSCPKFNTRARPISSPVILRNLDATATAGVQALFSIVEPGASACSLGTTSLVVLDIVGSGSTATVVQSQGRIVPGQGRSAGVMVGAGGVLMSATSGRGSGTSSVSVVAGEKKEVSLTITNNNFGARVLGITEVGN